MLVQVYGDNAMKKKWVTHFSEGRESITDELNPHPLSLSLSLFPSLPHCPHAGNIGNKGSSLFLVVQFVVTSTTLSLKEQGIVG
jgi:hypothetical protein